MRVPTIYLETTIFNFPFADDAPQYQADTLRLFAEIKAGKFRPFTSEYVLDELADTQDAERLKNMRALIADHGVEVLPGNDETMRLAGQYIAAGVIPDKYSTDAIHIAAATVAGLDYIVQPFLQHIRYFIKHFSAFSHIFFT